MRRLMTRTAVPLAFVLGGIATPVAIAALPATADVPAPATAAAAQYGEPWLRTELYFGTDRPTGPDVSDAQFRRFLAAEVTPRFPDGLTELTGRGQFRDSTGVIVRERSHLLVLLYPRTDTEAHREIQEIRDAYEKAFDQESVLRVDSAGRVSF